MVEISEPALAPRHRRNARRCRRLARPRLVAHLADDVGAGTDEGKAGAFHRSGEIGVLRQKAIARMDGVRAHRRCGTQDRFPAEVGFRRLRRADLDRLVGELHRQHVAVGLAEDLRRREPQLTGCTDDPDRNLAAIGDEDLRDRHQGWVDVFHRSSS
jgi:hypothetical protein